MKCREAKQEMALHLGHDGSDRARWEEVRRHVSGCISCRVHYGRLKKALAALDQSEMTPTYETRDSLWPELQERLQVTPSRRTEKRFQNWMPVAGVTVACVLVLAFWGTLPDAQRSPMSQPPVGRNISSDPFKEWSRTGREPAAKNQSLEVEELLHEGR